MIGYDVVAGAGIDDVRAATAVDRVIAGTGCDRVRRSRSGNGDGRRQGRRINILEIGNIGGIGRRLIDVGEVDGRRGPENQRVGAGGAIDRQLGAVIGDRVVTATRGDDISTA